MTFRLLPMLLFGLLLLGCSQEAAPAPTGPTPLAFRFEVPAGTPGAVSWSQPDDSVHTSWFGPAHPFHLSWVGETKDSKGNPGIAFEIAQAESESFSDLTEAHTNKLMAIEVEGEILSAPNIMSRLPGQGVLTSNSQDGYTPEELERLLAILQPSEG